MSPNDIEARAVQFSKAPELTVFTLLGIVIFVKDVQPSNPLRVVSSGLSPNDIEVTPVQPENAFAEIVFTLLGMVTLVNETQPLNAFVPIDVVRDGIVTFDNLLQF